MCVTLVTETFLLLQAQTNANDSMEKWFMQSVGRKWAGWKREAKQEGYLRYDNDADRVTHKPERVTEQQWRCLVYHWSLPKVQVFKFLYSEYVYHFLIYLKKDVFNFCFNRPRVLKTSEFGVTRHYYTRLVGRHIMCFTQRFKGDFINLFYFLSMRLYWVLIWYFCINELDW